MQCIKCDGTIGSLPGKAGFHCGKCGSHFFDFGRMGGAGQELDLSAHRPEIAMYRCPVDRESLRRYVINGLEFEYCPACRHVWLDRQEAEDLASKVAIDGASIPGAKVADGGGSKVIAISLDGDAAGLLIDALFSLIGAVGDW